MRKNKHIKFQDLNHGDLWDIRKQVVLGSESDEDYRNDFEFSPKFMRGFFMGYIDWLYDIAVDDDVEDLSVESVIEKYDDADTLFDYYWNIYPEFADSAEYEPEWDEDDEREYERYWNGSY